MADDKKTKVHISDNDDGTFDVDITCRDCNKPIVVSNEYGMFCEDRCGESEAKAISERFDKALGNVEDHPLSFLPAMNQLFKDMVGEGEGGIPLEYFNSEDGGEPE